MVFAGWVAARRITAATTTLHHLITIIDVAQRFCSQFGLRLPPHHLIVRKSPALLGETLGAIWQLIELNTNHRWYRT